MSALAQDRRHRWTVAEYHHHIERGAFRPEDRIELIEGELIDMPPIGPDHAASIDRLNSELNYRLFRKTIVRVQNPITLDDHSEPEPDIVLARWREDFYRHGHPGPEDCLLLIEVADSSLDYDRLVKVPLYARHWIPEVWLIDLVHLCVEVYRDPDGKKYRATSTHREGRITCARIPEAWLQIEDVFGR